MRSFRGTKNRIKRNLKPILTAMLFGALGIGGVSDIPALLAKNGWSLKNILQSVWEGKIPDGGPAKTDGRRKTDGMYGKMSDPYAGIEVPTWTEVANAGTYARNACPKHAGLLGGKEPKVSEQVAAKPYYVHCNTQYVNAAWGASKTGLWSAWMLTAESLREGRGMSREDTFRADDRLPVKARATPSDYKGSGFDRGHIFPNADSANRKSQYESYLLSNMFPQVAEHNRGIWSELEQRTRRLALKKGRIYVVTGVAFKGKNIAKAGNGGLYVPTHVYKAVYIPKERKGGACLSVNTASSSCEWLTLDELKKYTGTDAFPALAANDEARKTALKW